MSNDAPERAKGFRVEWNRREAKRIAEIAQARADALTTAQARIAELEAALTKRDGMRHAHDCQIGQGGYCDCGHSEAVRALEAKP